MLQIHEGADEEEKLTLVEPVLAPNEAADFSLAPAVHTAGTDYIPQGFAFDVLQLV
jgi:hypothetical protein